MPYVLLILIMVQGSPNRPAIATHDFITQQGCERARQMFLDASREAMARESGWLIVVAVCAPAASLSNG